jgi:RNA polymerase sigma-70 factor, ECF subfamily
MSTTINENVSAPPHSSAARDELYDALAKEYAAALGRLAAAYEADPQRRQDLVQDIHLNLWRSLASFDGNCSARTWVYRIAHNTAATHVVRERRHRRGTLIEIEKLEEYPDIFDGERAADEANVVERLQSLLRRLKPLDRQVILLYFEGEKHAEIARITGLSTGNVATKVHRLKELLVHHFNVEISQ